MKFKGKEIKACIFDLDGTLLDSCSIWKEVDERFFEKRGIMARILHYIQGGEKWEKYRKIRKERRIGYEKYALL